MDTSETRELKLHESEYRFMEIIWRNGPLKSSELAKRAAEELGWKKSTSYTVLKKMVERGFAANDHAVVYAVIEKEQVQKYESETLINKSFEGSLPAFLTAFLKGRKLSEEEAKEIHRMIEEYTEETDGRK